MKTFNAEVKTDYDTYFIDYKPDNQENNRFAVWSYRRGAVYLETVSACMAQIDHYDDLDIERATWINELEHNQ